MVGDGNFLGCIPTSFLYFSRAEPSIRVGLLIQSLCKVVLFLSEIGGWSVGRFLD